MVKKNKQKQKQKMSPRHLMIKFTGSDCTNALFPQGKANNARHWWQCRRGCDHAQVSSEVSEP